MPCFELAASSVAIVGRCGVTIVVVAVVRRLVSCEKKEKKTQVLVSFDRRIV